MSVQRGVPTNKVAMSEEKRQQALDLIWKHTDSDFKGHAGERWNADRGERTILIFRNGTCLVLLRDLTDSEIEDKLKYANHCLVKDGGLPLSLS